MGFAVPVSFGRSWAAPLALAWGLLAAMVATAQAPPTTTTAGLEEVEVDLASGVLKGVLPFDETFLLTGSAPAGVVRIGGEWCYLGRDAAQRLPEILTEFRAKGDIDTCPVSDARKAKPVALTPWVAPENTGDDSGAAPARTFYLLVAEPLEPNQNLLFLFETYRLLSATELAAFQPAVRADLDTLFRALERRQPQPASLTAPIYGEIQAGVRRALERQGGVAGRATAQPGSLFDTTAAPSADPPWSEPFDAVYEAQIRRRVIPATASDRARMLFAALGYLGAEPAGLDATGDEATVETALANLDAALAGLTTDQRNQLAHLLPDPALAAVDTLRRAPRTYLANVANGLAPLDGTDWKAAGAVITAGAPPELWTVADLAPLVAAMGATRTALADLADLTRTAAQVDVLRNALGPDGVAGMAPLRTSVERARDLAGRLLNDFARLQPILAERDQALDTLATFLRREARSDVPIVATSTGSFTTRASNHVSADVGVLYAGEIGQVLPYFGANFYTRPVNRNVPLSQFRGFDFRRRFSFMVGVTVDSVKETSPSGRVLRDDLFASSALVVGAGLRLTDSARMSVGALVFQQNDPNPLVDELELTPELFLSFSIDWDVRSVLGNVGSAIAPGN